MTIQRSVGRVDPQRRKSGLFAAGLLLCYAAAIFERRFPPSMTDYANWTYQGVLLARRLHGFADAAHALKPYPVPNSAATVGIGLLAFFLSWQVAAKLWLCVQMCITWVAIKHLARTIHAGGAVWAILPQTVLLGVNWWYGFMNFQLALAWTLLVASMLLRRADEDREREWPIGLLLVLVFFTHMIPFLFCGLLVVLYAWQTGRRRVIRQLVPAALLTVWYVAGRYLEAGNADGQAGMVAPVRNYSAAFWAYKANSYFKSFGFVNPGGVDGSVALAVLGKWLFLAAVAVTLLLAGLLGWRMVSRCMQVLRAREPERFVWIATLVFLPFFLLAPGTALGVSDPGSRLLQTSLALGLALACRGKGRLLRAASLCSGALALAALVLFVRVQLGPPMRGTFGLGVPRAVAQFAHVPFDDQDYFYGALDGGEYTRPVFPTGLFLNQPAK